MSHLDPYRPTAARPWDAPTASRFLRRVGFAASPAEVDAAVELGLAGSIDRLFLGQDESAASQRHDEIDRLGERIARRSPGEIGALRGWWLHRMAHSNRPLRERMLVLWHDHFATSHAKVASSPLMLRQLRTFEKHVFGDFGDLLRAVSRDPAMIIWLDGDDNVKGRPNENYARELLELFSLGIGNYGEVDIRETARAFTGWHQRNERFRFSERSHDGGAKTLFGSTGAFDGDDVIEILLRQKACARFLATKLLREFLTPDPPDELVGELAAEIRQRRFRIEPTLRTLFASTAMFDPRWFRSRIKSPVELLIGLVRPLELTAPAAALAGACSQMSQRLFEPPSVAGWSGHRGWLDSATMLVRLNSTVSAIAGSGDSGIRFRPDAVRRQHGLDDRESVEAFCRQVALDDDVPETLRNRLDAATGSLDDVMREGLQLLLSSPEYQLV